MKDSILAVRKNSVFILVGKHLQMVANQRCEEADRIATALEKQYTHEDLHKYEVSNFQFCCCCCKKNLSNVSCMMVFGWKSVAINWYESCVIA